MEGDSPAARRRRPADRRDRSASRYRPQDRSTLLEARGMAPLPAPGAHRHAAGEPRRLDRKSTRLNSSHGYISYAVFCLKKKTQQDADEPVQDEREHVLDGVHVG